MLALTLSNDYQVVGARNRGKHCSETEELKWIAKQSEIKNFGIRGVTSPEPAYTTPKPPTGGKGVKGSYHGVKGGGLKGLYW